MTFAVNDRIVVIAIDHKPKTTENLRRLRNIKENGQVSLLVDEYDDRDWTRLWWVRADGVARVLDDPQERAEPFSWLSDKYEQYRDQALGGPVIWIGVETVHGWSYTG